MWKRATLTKLDEYELLILLHSSYYKDHFRTFDVQIAYSSAEIKLCLNWTALNLEKPSVAIFNLNAIL